MTSLAGGPLTGLLVLVVEDNFYLADDTRSALEAAGAEILGLCRDAVEGLRLALSRRPDCAVLDVNLGAGPAFDPARSFRKQGVPFLFMTGYDAEVVPSDLRDIERLEKPVSGIRLVAAVAKTARGHGSPGRYLFPRAKLEG